MSFWEQESRPAPESVAVDGTEIGRGSRVLLNPSAGRDIMDIALSGKVGIVAKIEQDFEEKTYIAVTLEEDPGRELGEKGVLGHRFFFSPEEVVPLDVEESP